MEASTHSSESHWIPLPRAGKGQRVRVQRLDGHEDLCHRLRELGFCELAEVMVVNNGGTMICQVCGSKVCLSRKIADSIYVEPAVAS